MSNLEENDFKPDVEIADQFQYDEKNAKRS